MSTIFIILIVLIALFVKAENSETSEFRILIEHAISSLESIKSIYKPRTSLRAEITPPIAGELKASNSVTWRLRAESSGKGEISREDIPLLELGGLYRVRAKIYGTSDATFVYGYTKVCLLLAGDFKHDIFMSLDSNGTLHSIDIRPSVLSNFSSCRGSTTSSLKDISYKLSTSGGIELTGARFGITTIEEVSSLPVVNTGKGIPHIGQAEVTKEEAIRIASKVKKVTTSAAAGEEPSGPSIEEVLSEAENAAAQKTPEEPTTLQKYMPYLLGAYVVFSLSKQFLAADPTPAQAPARAR